MKNNINNNYLSNENKPFSSFYESLKNEINDNLKTINEE